MFKSVAAFALLAGLASSLVAAPVGGTQRIAPASDIALSQRAAKPRAAAFVSSLFPDVTPAARLTAPKTPAPKIADGYDLVVFAPTRPVRIRVTLRHDGKTFAERWTNALRKAYKGFDRDGDGTLNGHEVQYIFSDAALAQLMQTAYYLPNPTNAPTLDKLDLDRDRRVSFDEFAAYYKMAVTRTIMAYPPADEVPFNAQTTEALFKLLDLNGDGKLTKAEVTGFEALLATKDSDEDECLNLMELLGMDGFQQQRRIQVEVRNAPNYPRPPQNVVYEYELNGIPGTLMPRVLKEYDKNDDGSLTAAESGFDSETFKRLDTNEDDRLSPEELDAWRTGPADIEATLSLSAKPADCKVTIHTDEKLLAARGFTLKTMESGRVMVRHGRQAIELWAFAPVYQNGRGYQLKQNYLYLFQQLAQKKGYVDDTDFTGMNAVVYQQVRVLLEPADFNSDGRLTQAEFDRYFDLQQPFADLALSFMPAVQTPTLFELLDKNKDGKLGVRELRTAWSRLRALEPPGSDEVVTRAAILPAVSIRLSRNMDRGFVAQQVYYPNPYQVTVPKDGPLWFRKMDRNGDGDVSRIEFLGTKAEFDAIDTDHDGLVSREEAEAWEKAMRGK
jgi:Ca2+-binding EF-hand superfamily protein